MNWLHELYLMIYCGDVSQLARYAFAVFAVWTVLSVVCCNLAVTRRGWMWTNRVLAGLSELGVLTVTVLSRLSDQHEVGLYLLPFQIPEESCLTEEYFRMLFMNALLFFPLGLTLVHAWDPRRPYAARLGSTVAGGGAWSLVCELLQGIFRLGTVEMDDLLMNTIGALLGALCILPAWIVARVIRSATGTHTPRTPKK